MIRAIVWKEFREQGLIALTLMVLGTGVLVAAAVLGDPPVAGAGPADVVRYLGAGRLATLMLAVTAGTVCGGALFAAEREAGTMGFLEALPVSRAALWRAKLAAGSALALGQIGFVVGVAAVLGLVDSPRWAAAIAVDALLAFAWGLYGSTLARTTLGSVGVAVPAATLAAFAFLVPITLLFHNPGGSLVRAEGTLAFVALMLVTPVCGSALRFTRPDRERAADDPTPVPRRPAALPDDAEEPGPEPVVGTRSRAGLGALLWLAVRQLRRPGLIISGFALAFGFTLLLPGTHPVLVWPILALTAGVLAGVTVFADEQAGGIARFWGERRLPVGRVWAVKVAVHLAFAGWLAVLVALPAAVRAEVAQPRSFRGDTFLAGVFRTQLFDAEQLGPQAWKFLLVPLVYGFAAGHLCGMLFRKVVVAAGVAGMAGGTAAALWVPSLLAGGVWHWQVWLPAALLLVPARLLARPWAADRLAARAPLATLAAGVAVAVLAQAAGVGYRVAEVRDEPAGEADLAYVAGLPPIDANDGGRTFRVAAERFARVVEQVGPAAGRPPRPHPMDAPLDRVPRLGWPSPDPTGPPRDEAPLGAWLARVYDDDQAAGPHDQTWAGLAAEAAGQPPGLYEHPLRVAYPATDVALQNARRMGMVVVAHGLRAQARGDPAAFPADLRTALALARSLRTGSVVKAAVYGRDVARTALDGTDTWLKGLAGRPDLIRAALAAVREDDGFVPTRVAPDGQVLPPVLLPGEPTDPYDPAPHLLAERYVARELLKAPGQWLPAQLTSPGGDREAVAPVVDLVGLAWNVPWERERGRRLLGLGYEGRPEMVRERAFIRGRPMHGLSFRPRVQTPTELAEADRMLCVYRRALILKLAVRAYQAESAAGAAPADVAELVAKGYLPSAPADPHDGRPFRYRVSEGETFPVPKRTGTEPTPAARAGQAVVWSVGPNGTDEGGRNPPVGTATMGRTDDTVFLVPLPGG